MWGLEALSASPCIMQTTRVTTAVPAATQVRWESERSLCSLAQGLLPDLWVSIATCCPFHTEAAPPGEASTAQEGREAPARAVCCRVHNIRVTSTRALGFTRCHRR